MTNDKLSTRATDLLRTLVEMHIRDGHPVGSKTLHAQTELTVSPATIRNIMADLEDRGFLESPHTSAGRIPSALGYRHYVDRLLPRPGASARHLKQELTHLSLRWAALDDFLQQMARRLTDFTGLMSLITHPRRVHQSLETIRLVRSDDRLLVMLVQDSSQASHLNLRLPHGNDRQIEAMEAWTRRQLNQNENGRLQWSQLPRELQACGQILRDGLESHQQLTATREATALCHGVSRLVAEPEFSRSARLQPLLELIDQSPAALTPLGQEPGGGVWIGHEHPEHALHHCSVVRATYRSGADGVGQVALVGPMRMAYATALAAVRIAAHHLDCLLN